MGYYENRGTVPRTNVVQYMERKRPKPKKKAKVRSKRDYDGTKSMLSKAKSFVRNIFKRQKV